MSPLRYNPLIITVREFRTGRLQHPHFKKYPVYVIDLCIALSYLAHVSRHKLHHSFPSLILSNYFLLYQYTGAVGTTACYTG